MNDLYIYLFKASAILALFYGIYHFFLQDEKFYKGIRIYLASSLLMAFVLPLVKMDFEVATSTGSSNLVMLLNAINLTADGNNSTGALENISSAQFLIGLYALVCFILILRSIIRISKTQNIIRNNPIDNFEGQELVKVDDETPNFSFLGKIVINNGSMLFIVGKFKNIIFGYEKLRTNIYNCLRIRRTLAYRESSFK